MPAPPSRALVVEQGANPSTDFFVRPRLRASGDEVLALGLNATPPETGTRFGTLVFVRYLTPAWRRWVEQNRAGLGRLVFFMDDDLFDLRAHAGLPWRYRCKLWHQAWRHQAWLKKMGAELWVSTPWLAEKYAHWSPLVLPPGCPYGNARPMNTLFYHGSASHQDEIRWLYPVVEAALSQDPTLCFEIIGNARVRAQFAALPRVHVLHPMKWPAYRALLGRPGRTIGLAPLLAGPFNAARSCTKFFDITRAGAVGIYADHPVYRPVVRHRQNGLLLPMDQQAWVDAILRLNAGEEERRAMLYHAQATVTG
ncbi:glycosyltransferase family 1 protein [Zobellella sp. CGMCC 1.18722]|uniref:Glycosyltransferase family 1 protein n=1 Tax=Zobellella iuensis TaxID=2803811 RepID=A0ABS1QU58_9GAMM|nr:glycosyltransferase family 1 protein [Zobellella iuensis]